MAYESYCAACTYMNENQNYGKYYCTRKGEWRKASDPKCYNFCEAYSRSNGGRENMYYYSSRYYITTAILSIVRALDNNYQIETLGNFIENTLRKDMQYFPLLVAYEIIGPQIASKLQEDPDKIKIATTMFYQYIKPTIKAIETNQTDIAVNTYKTMTLELADRYNIDTNIVLPKPADLNLSEQNKGYTRKRSYIKPEIKYIPNLY